MTETLHTVVVSRADMMRYYDPVRVQGYCQSCEKYGAYWSCPPFEAQPLSQLPVWTHAVLMAQKTPVDAGSTPADLVRQFLVGHFIFLQLQCIQFVLVRTVRFFQFGHVDIVLRQ